LLNQSINQTIAKISIFQDGGRVPSCIFKLLILTVNVWVKCWCV